MSINPVNYNQKTQENSNNIGNSQPAFGMLTIPSEASQGFFDAIVNYRLNPLQNLPLKEIDRTERFFEKLLRGAKKYDQNGKQIVIKEIKPYVHVIKNGFTVAFSITTDSGKTINIVPIHEKFKFGELRNLPQAIAKRVQNSLSV